MKRIILVSNKFCNIFLRKYTSCTKFPEWTFDKFKQYYLSQILPMSSVSARNPDDAQSYLASDYIRLALTKDQSHQAQVFKENLAKFIEDKNCQALAISGIVKLDNISKDRSCYFNILLASAIMAYGAKERIDSMIAFDSSPKKEVLPHIDIASPQIIPQYMAIIAVDSNSSVKTYIVENADVISYLQKHHQQILEILSKVNFKFRFDYEDNKNSEIFKMISVKDDGSYFICLPDDNKKFCIADSSQIEFHEEQIFQTIDKFRQIIKELPAHQFVMANDNALAYDLQFQKTQHLFFKNTKTLHGRGLVPECDRRNMVFVPFKDRDPNPNFLENVAKEFNRLKQISKSLEK